MPEPHAVYLEAKSEGARRLYERHGYQVVSEVRPASIAPTEVGGVLWPMVRRPAADKVLSKEGRAAVAHTRSRAAAHPMARCRAGAAMRSMAVSRGAVRRL